jgi:hypothetical protein
MCLYAEILDIYNNFEMEPDEEDLQSVIWSNPLGRKLELSSFRALRLFQPTVENYKMGCKRETVWLWYGLLL